MTFAICGRAEECERGAWDGNVGVSRANATEPGLDEGLGMSGPGVVRRNEERASSGRGCAGEPAEPFWGQQVGMGFDARGSSSPIRPASSSTSRTLAIARAERVAFRRSPRSKRDFSKQKGQARAYSSGRRLVGPRIAGRGFSGHACSAHRVHGRVARCPSRLAPRVGSRPAHALHLLEAVDRFDGASPQNIAVSWNQERMR